MKHAAPMLLLAALCGAAQAAEPLGRLFFTPAQRATLDAGKQLDLPRKAGPTVRGPSAVTLNGIVTRSDGESTVWVNGAPANAPRGTGNATIYAKPAGGSSARVTVMDSASKLRVGQTLDRRTGKVMEIYEHKPAPIQSDTTSKEAGSMQGAPNPSRPPKEGSTEN
jgi:hypothetical protein